MTYPLYENGRHFIKFKYSVTILNTTFIHQNSVWDIQWWYSESYRGQWFKYLTVNNVHKWLTRDAISYQAIFPILKEEEEEKW